MLAVFLDIETTGLDPQIHRVIDIAFKIVDFDSSCIVDSYESIVKQTKEDWGNHDPFSLQINGYTWDMVSQGREKSTVSNEIQNTFLAHKIVRGASVFICQNPAFDRTFFTQLIPISLQEKLQWPYHWLDLASMHWALLLQQCNKENRKIPSSLSLSKNEIAQKHGIPPEEIPHRAMNGVDHLIACYEAIFNIKFQRKGK